MATLTNEFKGLVSGERFMPGEQVSYDDFLYTVAFPSFEYPEVENGSYVLLVDDVSGAEMWVPIDDVYTV